MNEDDPVVEGRGRVRLIRGRRVLLDEDVAALYGVRTDALIRGVIRHRRRFPKDFLFRLEPAEARACRRRHGGSARRRPYAFTGEGVAMVSVAIRSKLAALVNVAIIRILLGSSTKDGAWAWLQDLLSPRARA